MNFSIYFFHLIMALTLQIKETHVIQNENLDDFRTLSEQLL